MWGRRTHFLVQSGSMVVCLDRWTVLQSIWAVCPPRYLHESTKPDVVRTPPHLRIWGSCYHGRRKARSTREQSETARRAPTVARHRAASSVLINMTTSTGRFCTVTITTLVSPHADSRTKHWKMYLTTVTSPGLRKAERVKTSISTPSTHTEGSRWISPLIHNLHQVNRRFHVPATSLLGTKPQYSLSKSPRRPGD
jgi:hypothetical protein